MFPILALFFLLWRGLQLDGAATGIKFYVTPDWAKLLSVSVWTDAASQIFYSLGPAFGVNALNEMFCSTSTCILKIYVAVNFRA